MEVQVRLDVGKETVRLDAMSQETSLREVDLSHYEENTEGPLKGVIQQLECVKEMVNNRLTSELEDVDVGGGLESNLEGDAEMGDACPESPATKKRRLG